MILHKSFSVIFYQEPSGKEPVREWLKDFNKADRKIIDRDVKSAQYAWPMEMPLIKLLGDKLMEIRTKLENRQVRIFFVLHKGSIVLLHGIVKKTQKTPKNELDTARKRLKQVKGR